ncbi:hypothetical protein NDU88_001895 [Pleurodeles waltl]|uniref:Uncharacterized protein n=1 Tax=Pleurodeles waltl TaxID=8319 RepID=A0AAV7MN03_PLEWA|nr:hypothetical protein NDU88_001895 [Pleurodeles waltl]
MSSRRHVGEVRPLALGGSKANGDHKDLSLQASPVQGKRREVWMRRTPRWMAMCTATRRGWQRRKPRRARRQEAMHEEAGGMRKTRSMGGDASFHLPPPCKPSLSKGGSQSPHYWIGGAGGNRNKHKHRRIT